VCKQKRVVFTGSLLLTLLSFGHLLLSVNFLSFVHLHSFALICSVFPFLYTVIHPLFSVILKRTSELILPVICCIILTAI